MNTTKVGQGMFAVALILGIAMLTMYFGGVEERRHNPNQDPQSILNAETIEVRLRQNRQGHYVMTGTINSHPVELLLDTGATDVVIPAALADQLQLKRGRAGRAMTANGPVTIYDTNITELTIGEITLYNVNASINPAMRPPSILLGMSALRQIEFVQSGSTLTLKYNGNWQ
jgi:aspartyl protease family protein